MGLFFYRFKYQKMSRHCERDADAEMARLMEQMAFLDESIERTHTLINNKVETNFSCFFFFVF